MRSCIKTQLYDVLSKNTTGTKKYFLRKKAVPNEVYGNFERKLQTKIVLRGFLNYRAVDKFHVKKPGKLSSYFPSTNAKTIIGPMKQLTFL